MSRLPAYYIFRKKRGRWIHHFTNTKDAILTAFEDSFTDRNHDGEQYYFFKSSTGKRYRVFVKRTSVYGFSTYPERFGLSKEWHNAKFISHGALQLACVDLIENGQESMDGIRKETILRMLRT